MKSSLLRNKTVVSVLGLSVLLSPTTLQAQTTTPTPTTLIIDESQLGNAESATQIPPESIESLNTYVDSRNACLEDYQLGSVLFTFDETDDSRIAEAGQPIAFSGTIKNTNTFPMPQGKVFVRILREDATVADENWHPIVAEFTLPEEFNIPAQGEAPFLFTWIVPTTAQTGEYRAEFNFLGAGRYSLTGLTFVPNFTGGNSPFYVKNGGSAQHLNFARDSVTLNDSPYALRSVPPQFQPGIPLTIGTSLQNAGTVEPITANVTMKLFEWSDTDGEAPVAESTQEVTIAPGQSTPLTFTWDQTLSGVYELVMTAEPLDGEAVPSILRVRFPVEGNTPRIMFSGITDVTNGEATITTCVINGTVGTGGGSVTTAAVINGQTLGSTTGELEAGILTTTSTTVPINDVANPLLVSTEAKDENGVVTDSHMTAYKLDELLPNTENSPVEAADTVNTVSDRTTMWLVIAIVSIVVLILIAVIVGLVRKRKPPTLLPPDSNQPL